MKITVLELDERALHALFLYNNPFVKLRRYSRGKEYFCWYDDKKKKFLYQCPMNKRNGVYEARGLMGWLNRYRKLAIIEESPEASVQDSTKFESVSVVDETDCPF